MQQNKFTKLTTLIAAIMLVSSYASAQVNDATVKKAVDSIKPAHKSYAFTAKQAVEFGLKNSVQVKNALLDVLIQKEVNDEVSGAALPQINASGTMLDNLEIQTIVFPGQNGVLTPFKAGLPWTSSGSITFSQILFDGTVFLGLKARKTFIDIKRSAVDVTEENIKTNIYKIYYQLVVSRAQTSLLDANIDRLSKLNHDVNIIYKNGFVEKLDVDKLTVQIANLQTEKLMIESGVNNGYNALKVLMGIPVKDTLVLTDTLSDNEIREGVLENSTYKYHDRKEFRALEYANKLNGLNIKRFQQSRLPVLSLIGNYGVHFDAYGKWYTSSYVGLNLSVPIFRGFAIKSRVDRSRLELKQTQNQMEALKISIDSDVENAKTNFATAIATMDFQKKNMELAELIYNQTKKKYEVGTGSSTEINASQTDLKAAQTNYIQALYDAIIAKVDFLKAVGKL
ncbi:MAG: TolC family protein [Sphingobacteriales bacterium]|nr:TolC family protein [Sphingobacteriales bacterium]